MSYQTRAYDKENYPGFAPDPVVVMVVTGTHDISRLLHTLSRGTIEQIDLAEHVTRQVNRHNSGRAALKLLRDHGGPDLLEKFGLTTKARDPPHSPRATTQAGRQPVITTRPGGPHNPAATRNPHTTTPHHHPTPTRRSARAPTRPDRQGDNRLNWYERPFVAFDTETTGVDPETARIVTASVITIDPATGTKHVREWLADPGIEIPTEATAIHGITTQHARQHGRPALEVIHEIAATLTHAWTRGEPVAIYNASYDLTLLARELGRHHSQTLDPATVIDPLVIDKHFDRYRKGSRKLTATAAHYGIELSEQDAHTATADALAAARLAWKQAHTYPDLATMRAPDLHAHQIHWHTEQATSLQKYFRDKGSNEIVPPEWPLRPQASATAA